MTYIKYPSTVQFKNVLKHIRSGAAYHGTEVPTLEYEGTIKLHGTNGSISYDTHECKISYLSRNNVLEVGKDNAGFHFAMTSIIGAELWQEIFDKIIHEYSPKQRYITISGEWAGQGVQSGVAVSEIPKTFFVFGVRFSDLDSESNVIDQDQVWLGREVKDLFIDQNDILKSIYGYQTVLIQINFCNPVEAVNVMTETVERVENKCPVGLAFGVEGVGEGLVWKPTDKQYHNNPAYWFKTKGEKHSDSKVKTLIAIDPEKAKSLDDFCSMVITDHRLEKGIEFLQQSGYSIDMKSTGHFLKWVMGDVIKEESDSIVASMLEPRDISKPLSIMARNWFINYVNRL